MEKKHWFILAVILIVGGIIYFVIRIVIPPNPDEMTEITCGPGKVVYRYKYPSKAYPVLINDYSVNLKVATALLDRVLHDSGSSSSLDLDVKNTARALRDTLDQDNIFYENYLKSFFITQNNSPCDDTLRYRFSQYIEQMSYKVVEMKLFVKNISQPAAELKADEPAKDSVIAYIDTATSSVKSSTESPKDERVVLNRPTVLTKAIKVFSHRYDSTKKSIFAPTRLVK